MTETGIVTDHRLDATHVWSRTQEQQDEAVAWIEANGHTPGARVEWAELDLVDAPLVRVQYYPEDYAGQTDRPVREYLLRVPPPAWWQPDTGDLA